MSSESDSCRHPLELLQKVAEPITLETVAFKCVCGEMLSELRRFTRLRGTENVSDLHDKNCYYCNKDIQFVKSHSHTTKVGRFGELTFGGQCVCGHHARVVVLARLWKDDKDIMAILKLDLQPYQQQHPHGARI